jgi:hypothetical protein
VTNAKEQEWTKEEVQLLQAIYHNVQSQIKEWTYI